MRRLLIGAAITLAIAIFVLAGCGSGGVPSYTTQLPAADPADPAFQPVPLSLIDQVGIVTAVAAVPTPAASSSEPVVEAVPAGPDVLRVTWLTGKCDDRVTMVLNDLGGVFQLTIHNHPPITGGLQCDESTVARAIDIGFNRHLDSTQLSAKLQYP